MPVLHSLIRGEGEALLIVHGLFGMGDNWKTLATKFVDRYEVHLIDQRNHGRSFHSDDFNYDLMVEDLWRYIDHHKLSRVNLLGHSMGGKTIMLFAVTFPEMVDKLVVADIAPRYYPPHHEFILEALKAIDFDQMRSRIDIDTVLKKYIPELNIRQFLSKNVYRKTKDEFSFRFNLDSLIENIEDLGDGLPSMTQYEGATLFLRGENSDYITKDDVDLISAHFSNNKIITIANSGHWLHAENPVDFYKYVAEFLENV